MCLRYRRGQLPLDPSFKGFAPKNHRKKPRGRAEAAPSARTPYGTTTAP
jgi:hypothetical protein